MEVVCFELLFDAHIRTDSVLMVPIRISVSSPMGQHENQTEPRTTVLFDVRARLSVKSAPLETRDPFLCVPLSRFQTQRSSELCTLSLAGLCSDKLASCVLPLLGCCLHQISKRPPFHSVDKEALDWTSERIEL